MFHMKEYAYGRYRKVRDAAWHCLIDHNIHTLPVDLLSIAKQSGIKAIQNSRVNELSPGERSVCYQDGHHWYLIFDDTAPLGQRRLAFAHELGHIFLGHELKTAQGNTTFVKNRPRMEMEADMFGLRILAPSCVLWGMGLETREEIAAACQIPSSAAQIRATRMSKLNDIQMFLANPLEEALYKKFYSYIKRHLPPEIET